MFFLPVPLRPGVPFREIFSQWGLDGPAQARALAHEQNAPLRWELGGRPISAQHSLPTSVRGGPSTVCLHVPIAIELNVTRYLTRVDQVDGLLPRPVGETGPPVHTHGMDVRIERNLGAATKLRWIQTTTRRNDHTHTGRRTEFVDGAVNDQPWLFPEGPQEAFTDLPCAPAPQRAGAPGTDFEATATLAVLFESRIILAAGITWGFNVNSGTPGIVGKSHRAATAVDFEKQLRILQAGVNVFGMPAGGRLNYEVAPRNGTVLRPAPRRAPSSR